MYIKLKDNNNSIYHYCSSNGYNGLIFIQIQEIEQCLKRIPPGKLL